jgi:preprotein translocase, SecE subunit, bacterial
MTDAVVPASDPRKKTGATRKRDERPDEEKIGFFAKIIRFVRETINEMRKVKYPTGAELWTFFLVVVVFVAILMAYTGVIDYLSGWLSKLVFR